MTMTIKQMNMAVFLIASVYLTSIQAAADGSWEYFTSMNDLRAIEVSGDNVWCVSTCGVIRWHRADGSYRKYYSYDGIPFHTINTVFPGRYENVYFGTHEIVESDKEMRNHRGYGVFGFDGDTWSRFYGSGLRDGTIAQVVAVDPAGSLWFSIIMDYATDDQGVPPESSWCGLSIYNGREWHYMTVEDSGLLDDCVTAVAWESESVVWFGYRNGAVSRFDGAAWNHFTQESCDLLQYRVSEIFVDSDNTKWFVTPHGIMSFDGETWNTVFDTEVIRRITADQGENGVICFHVCIDMPHHENRFYVTGDSGLKQVPVDLTELSSEADVRDIAVGDAVDIWVATDIGLYTNYGGAWIRLDDTDLPPTASGPVFIDGTNNIWTAYHMYDGASWKEIEEDFGSYKIQAFGEDNNGYLLAGTSQQLLRFVGSTWKHITYGNISKIVVSSDGIIWCRHNMGLDDPVYVLLRYEDGTRTVFHQQFVNDLSYDGIEFVWAAENNGIGKYIRTRMSLYVGDIYVREIEVDATGTVWYVANDMLYSIINGRFGKYYPVTGENITLSVDKKGIVWTASSEGVFSCDGKTMTEYTVRDGLLRKEVRDIIVGPDNAKWFVFNEGVLGIARFSGKDETSVSRPDEPVYYELSQNYPNPFNPVTTITLFLPESGDACLTIYDVTGRKVADLVNGFLHAGRYDVTWDAADFASGVYIYRLKAFGFEKTGKMTLVK